ncbi:MAG: methionine biosynthesis protein MetW [Porticoccaceae bacterium]|nr:methionine biosynthesis protein MetW [Porticoccaceae bacterium]
MRVDFDILQHWVSPQSRVLDLGCGDGSLLKALKENQQIEGYGLEIDPHQISACVGNGVNVIEKNLDNGLVNFADKSFDTVIMTQALQVMRHPHLVLEEMLRVGKACIVTFPNFGNWRARCHLMFRGGMPVTKQLSYQWYDTPNIHFCTVADFESLCQQMGIRILDRQMAAERNPEKQLKGLWPNLFAETAIYHLSR